MGGRTKSPLRQIATIFFILIPTYACLHLERSLEARYAPASYSDYNYLLNIRGRHTRETGFHFLTVYSYLGKVLFSKCKNLPSDSQYLALMLSDKKCKAMEPLARSVGRVMREHDLSWIQAVHPVVRGESLHWINMPPQCGL